MKNLLFIILLINLLFGQASDFITQTIGHPDSTYKQLLRFGNNAASQDTLKQIFDGTGDSTALFLSHDSVKVQGVLVATYADLDRETWIGGNTAAQVAAAAAGEKFYRSSDAGGATGDATVVSACRHLRACG